MENMSEKLKGSEGKNEEETEKERIFNGLKEKLLALLDKDWEKNNGEILKHRDRLKGKYDDLKEYALYYVLTSPSYKKCKQFDFPDDEYSIEKFIERLEEKQEKRDDEQMRVSFGNLGEERADGEDEGRERKDEK